MSMYLQDKLPKDIKRRGRKLGSYRPMSNNGEERDNNNVPHERIRDATNVLVERAVHERIKEYAEQNGLEIKQFATNRLNMMLDKIEFNKRYFGSQYSIKPTDVTDMVLVHDAKKDQTYSITLENNKLHCGVCKSSNCIHVFYALSTPDCGVLHSKLPFK